MILLHLEDSLPYVCSATAIFTSVILAEIVVSSLLPHTNADQFLPTAAAPSSSRQRRPVSGNSSGTSGLRAPWPWEGILAAAMGEEKRGMAPQQRTKESPSRGEMAWGKRRERAGAAIYRAKLWTCQTAPTGGRCCSDDLGRRVSAFFAWNRILVAAQNIFLDLYSTIIVKDLESYRSTKIGLSLG
uniref:Uncharacterized protein n=1 Tax=Zea mays TaxID=4577 RepID=A0A804MFL4_MAIZE